ncbi:MAG: glycosyltransferase family 2 protein [Saprospiraceae bacterium]|nr:glycosyltransferase family 2 protein [Saprospiraceae bacterium]
MPKITAIIPTYNEATNMRPLLSSLEWADEIIVIDSFSTDATVEIAKEFDVQLYQRNYVNSANQKNWVIPKASHEWIFLVDADERLTTDLVEELRDFQKNGNSQSKDAYWIGRQNFFMNQRIKYSGWRGDAVIRLFKKECRYEDKHVHAEIITTDKQIGYLNGKLEHHTYRNLNHFLRKMERYSDWAAQDYLAKVKQVGLYHLFLKPAFRFFKHYIWQRGIFDGRVGFIISALMAWGVFLRYAKIKELKLKRSTKK